MGPASHVENRGHRLFVPPCPSYMRIHTHPIFEMVHCQQTLHVDSLIMEHKQDLGHKEPHRPAPTEVETTAEEGVSFFHDFVAGGVAGSASVVVGHPFDTLKVIQ